MSDFVKKLGETYFYERWTGAWFRYGNDICSVRNVPGRDGQVHCGTLDGRSLNIPLDFFVGFEILKYPELGYRRVGNTLIYYISKNQGYLAGIRDNSITKSPTPVSQLLLQHVPALYSSTMITDAIFNPTFDSPDDWPALLNGDKSGLVLSNTTVVEPSLRAGQEGYDVFFKGELIGGVSEDGIISASNRKNKQFISGVIGR